MARDSVTGGVREGLSSPKQLFLWEGSHIPSLSYAEGTPFSYEKKMEEKIRKPTRLDREKSHAKKPCETGAPAVETTTEAVAPFGQMPPTHQQTAALQLLEVSPIRQAVPLLNEKEAA